LNFLFFNLYYNVNKINMDKENCYIEFYGVDANDYLFEEALRKFEEENESKNMFN